MEGDKGAFLIRGEERNLMKKMVLTASALCMAVSLAACSSKSEEAEATAAATTAPTASAAATEETIGMPNPWTDYETLEEAEAAVGFDVTLPPEKDMYPNIEYRVDAEEGIIEVYCYNAEDQLTVRKAAGVVDNLSGVYEEYDAHMLDMDSGATLDGPEDDKYNVAQWSNDEYSYSIYVTVPLSEEAMLRMVGELQ